MTVLFHRSYRRFTGGHLKVFDYFNHVLASGAHSPLIRFSQDSVWDDSNPWREQRARVLEPMAEFRPDVLFLDGEDWLFLEASERGYSSVPIINLIQHVRHAHPDDPRYEWLGHKAVRLCVSEEVADAIRQTQRVNGPVIVIPNGIDLNCFSAPLQDSIYEADVFIAALKQPELGSQLRERLARPDRQVHFRQWQVPRMEYLNRLRNARVTVFLPNPTEGFYLPALEGMASGTLVVCPDCVGNRSFCRDGLNCFRPDATLESIAAAAETALAPGLDREARALP